MPSDIERSLSYSNSHHRNLLEFHTLPLCLYSTDFLLKNLQYILTIANVYNYVGMNNVCICAPLIYVFNLEINKSGVSP